MTYERGETKTESSDSTVYLQVLDQNVVIKFVLALQCVRDKSQSSSALANHPPPPCVNTEMRRQGKSHGPRHGGTLPFERGHNRTRNPVWVVLENRVEDILDDTLVIKLNTLSNDVPKLPKFAAGLWPN